MVIEIGCHGNIVKNVGITSGNNNTKMFEHFYDIFNCLDIVLQRLVRQNTLNILQSTALGILVGK
jgi:hypothetical protein